MANKENTKLKEESLGYPNWVLTDRQICDLEMILNGGFSPLSGFLGKKDYDSVVNNLRLDDVGNVAVGFGLEKQHVGQIMKEKFSCYAKDTGYKKTSIERKNPIFYEIFISKIPPIIQIFPFFMGFFN